MLLMRHGVCPPTSPPKFPACAAQPFPINTDWGAPDGNLTPDGASLVQVVGALERALYSQRGLLPAAGCPSDDMPPAGTRGVEVLSNAAAKNFFVRPIYFSLTLAATHAGTPKAYYQPPIYESIQLPGCDLDSGRLCTLSAFITLMTAAIDPTQTAPMVYE